LSLSKPHPQVQVQLRLINKRGGSRGAVDGAAQGTIEDIKQAPAVATLAAASFQ
jgi:hypothetical protein